MFGATVQDWLFLSISFRIFEVTLCRGVCDRLTLLASKAIEYKRKGRDVKPHEGQESYHLRTSHWLPLLHSPSVPLQGPHLNIENHVENPRCKLQRCAWIFFILLCKVLMLESRAVHMLVKCSITETHANTTFTIFKCCSSGGRFVSVIRELVLLFLL